MTEEDKAVKTFAMTFKEKVAIVTGASSGFGAEIARNLVQQNIAVALGARRLDRLESLRNELSVQGGPAVVVHQLDVQSTTSVETFMRVVRSKFSAVNFLVNNAGFGHTVDSIESSKEEDWKNIWETNVMGSVRMIQAVLPLMKPHSGARIVNIGSVAGLEAYEGGGSYCSSKFALRAVTLGLRYELLEKGIGVSSVDPGMAETEFSLVRFDGDRDRAAKVYSGLKPLSALDVADIVGFVLSRPDHVNIDQVVVMPTAQASAKRVIRR